MDLLLVADPIASFKTYKDSSFAMLREAARRGHRLWACESRQLASRPGEGVTAPMRMALNSALSAGQRLSAARWSAPNAAWK